MVAAGATPEAVISTVGSLPQGADAMRLSLLSQIVSDISLSIQFDIDDNQRSRLVRSDNGLLKWLGLNAVERQLTKPEGLNTVLKLVTEFSYFEQMQALGWMISRAAKNAKEAEIYDCLVVALHATLPAAISGEELGRPD